MTKLELTALTNIRHKVAIVLAVLLVLMCVVWCMLTVVIPDNKPYSNFPIHVFIIVSWCTFIVYALFVQVFLPQLFELFFTKQDLILRTKNRTHISYQDVDFILIVNNSDYSKIVIKQKAGKEIKLYVGFANLFKNSPILLPSNKLDNELERFFVKRTWLAKGLEIIKFEKKCTQT